MQVDKPVWIGDLCRDAHWIHWLHPQPRQTHSLRQQSESSLALFSCILPNTQQAVRPDCRGWPSSSRQHGLRPQDTCCGRNRRWSGHDAFLGPSRTLADRVGYGDWWALVALPSPHTRSLSAATQRTLCLRRGVRIGKPLESIVWRHLVWRHRLPMSGSNRLSAYAIEMNVRLSTRLKVSLLSCAQCFDSRHLCEMNLTCVTSHLNRFERPRELTTSLNCVATNTVRISRELTTSLNCVATNTACCYSHRRYRIRPYCAEWR